MVRRLFILCIFMFTILCVYGQRSFTIEGKVVDEQGLAVPFANAALYTAQDSSLVTGAVSDETGYFKFQTSAGTYYLRVSFLSYEEKLISNIDLSANKNLGTIVLVASAQVLESVVIQAEKSQMELYLDKKVFQVGKDLSNISGSATDILENVPSVTVDAEGNVSLRGSGNVRILIDGKPSGLTGISTADAMRQLQGNLIERIEVITNPSAKFDAEGEVGIINIILKKETAKGINGSFALNAGYPDNYGASFNLNLRRKDMNFFSSYGFTYRSSPGSGFSNQYFVQPDTSFSYAQENKRNRSDRSHNFRAGMDYFLDERNTITGAFLIRLSDGLNTTNNIYNDYNMNGELVRTVERNERELEPETNTELALSYRREYQKAGQLLTADFKWIDNIETENATFNQTDYSIDSTGFQRSSNTENERNILAQIDYVQPVFSKGKFETGLRTTQRIIDNDFRVEQLDQENDTWFTLPAFNNNLVYTENIYAGYFIVGNESDRVAWQTGVRGELTDISIELLESGTINYQNYFNIFPSAHLSYKFSQAKTIQLSYSYRLSRPNFRDLMPFSNYSDNRSLFVGNPNLRPEYTHSLEASYLLTWEAGSILSSAYYRYKTGVIEELTTVDSVGFTRTQPVNLANEDAYGLEFNFSWNPVKWWNFNTNANFFRAITEGRFDEVDFFADTYSWTNRTTSRLTFQKKWNFQIGFNYRSPRITPQGESKSLAYFDLGLSRDLLKGNGTLTFSVRDVFNSRKFRSIVNRPDEGYYSEREFQWRARQLLLTFTYRLNMKKESGRVNDNGDFDNES